MRDARLIRGAYDPQTARVDIACTFVKGGAVTRSGFSVRVYTYSELCSRLAKAGLSSCQGRAGFSDEPYHLGARRLVLVATKG